MLNNKGGLTKPLYPVEETLQMLSMGRTHFYDHVKRGNIKITKSGRKTLVMATDLEDFLDKLRNGEAR